MLGEAFVKTSCRNIIGGTIEQQIAISNIGSDAQHIAISVLIIPGEGGADRHPGFKHLAAPSLASKS